MARGWPRKRKCRNCGEEFEVRERADANRQHCSRRCAKRHGTRTVRTWQAEHPDAMKRYNAARTARDPAVWRKKASGERLRVIEALGGACVACGVRNTSWLHVDFVPTQKGERFRHPRHAAFVLRNLKLFRLLCANHHYELTLTGRIEGTTITQ